jgi:hypothetical protein
MPAIKVVFSRSLLRAVAGPNAGLDKVVKTLALSKFDSISVGEIRGDTFVEQATFIPG